MPRSQLDCASYKVQLRSGMRGRQRLWLSIFVIISFWIVCRFGVLFRMLLRKLLIWIPGPTIIILNTHATFFRIWKFMVEMINECMAWVIFAVWRQIVSQHMAILGVCAGVAGAGWSSFPILFIFCATTRCCCLFLNPFLLITNETNLVWINYNLAFDIRDKERMETAATENNTKFSLSRETKTNIIR